MKDPESPSKKAGGKLLEFPSKSKLTPLKTLIWRTQTEELKILREKGLRLLQLWENDCASELKIEAPEDWERIAGVFKKEGNWLCLIAHCGRWQEARQKNIARMDILMIADEAHGDVDLLIQHLGQHDPRLAKKLSEILNRLVEIINNYEG